MHTHIWQEDCNGQSLAVELNAPAPDVRPSVLLLHGAGESHRGRSDYLIDIFVAAGLGCIRFDFSGHGESSGARAEASLARRLMEAKHIADNNLDHTQPLMIAGTSMGGHVASQLTALLPVAHLVLLCPAAYDRAAQTVPFGAGFTEIIRAPDSQTRSDIWATLQGFTGRATHIIGTADNIIPAHVSDMYAAALSHTNYARLDVPDAPHGLYEWLPQHPEWLARARDTILRA